jgi:hypothetical protein
MICRKLGIGVNNGEISFRRKRRRTKKRAPKQDALSKGGSLQMHCGLSILILIERSSDNDQ